HCCLLTSTTMFFFFFQAEDGIRDSSVTGVQTCALPICLTKDPSYPGIADDYRRTLKIFESLKPDVWLTPHNDVYAFDAKRARARSEERRVGKECRARGQQEHQKKNTRHKDKNAG